MKAVDELGRRLAAGQFVIPRSRGPRRSRPGWRTPLWRWRCGFTAEGMAEAGGGPTRPGRGRAKLTRGGGCPGIRELAKQDCSLAAIGEETRVSTATVQVALGHRGGQHRVGGAQGLRI